MKLELKFKREILKTFGKKRIVSLLYFGTRAFVGADNNSDYDFLVILDRYHPSDLLRLRKIVQRKEYRSLDLNINFLYLTDIKTRGKSNFQIRSLRTDFYTYLEKAIPIMGKNIFKNNPVKLTTNKLVSLMDFKIQEHYGRCDKLFVQNISPGHLYKQLRKYIKGIIRFILVREGIMSLEDITKCTYKNIFTLASQNKVFPKSTTSQFPLLMKNYVDIRSIKNIESVRRKVYQKYLKLFSKRV